jgi:hypothetical protein
MASASNSSAFPTTPRAYFARFEGPHRAVVESTGFVAGHALDWVVGRRATARI